MNVVRGNYEEQIRRNPQEVKAKLRGGGGDLMGDEQEQVENWRELVAEGEGEFESRIDEVGNAQDAVLAGTGDLDHVVRFAEDRAHHDKMMHEDSPDLINPVARAAAENDEATEEG
jgi:hypothetical protein